MAGDGEHDLYRVTYNSDKAKYEEQGNAYVDYLAPNTVKDTNGGFAITYGPSDMLDFFIKPYESFFAGDNIPKSILFIKRDNNLFFLMMFPVHKGNQFPKNLLYSLIN
jgi:hypothetical protein